MIKRFNSCALSLVATVLLAASTQAHSQVADEPINVTVHYGDLDINHAAGAKVLLHRIEDATVRACGGEPDLRVLQQRAAYDRCRKTAAGEAVAKVGSPIVTALASHDRLPVDVASR